MKKMIFIIDDNDTNLTVAASALEDDYRVLTMPAASKMFSLLEKMRPDLIVIDVEMPEMNGFEAVALLKANPRFIDIPVVFLTGWADESTRAKAMGLGAVDIVTKPFDMIAFISQVKEYIGE